jgi:methylated-DNA-[protein]-cysteine S-methyltransferase
MGSTEISLFTEKLATSHLFQNTLQTPFGEIIVASTEDALCFLQFSEENNYTSVINKLALNLKATIVQGSNAIIDQTERELNEYFEKKRTVFSVKVMTHGTPFQEKVWEVIKQIPHGKTLTYTRLASQLGIQESVRAVANATGANPIMIIIPCHRILGKNGELRGYAGGISRKRYLLDHECPMLLF